MTDRSFSLCTILAVLLWAAGLGLAVLDMFVGPLLGALAVILAWAGGVLVLHQAIHSRHRAVVDAFKLGKEAGHREAGGPRGV